MYRQLRRLGIQLRVEPCKGKTLKWRFPFDCQAEQRSEEISSFFPFAVSPYQSSPIRVKSVHNVELPPTVEKVHLKEWDKGVFASELSKLLIFPRKVSLANAIDGNPESVMPPDLIPPPIKEGTFHGTQLALTEMFNRIDHRFASFFDVTNLESTIPQPIEFEDKKDLYTFQTARSDDYPPHLNVIPKKDEAGMLKIFDFMRLADTATLVPRIVPKSILDWAHGEPEYGESIADIEQLNKTYRAQKKDVFNKPNIGDRADWYTDAVFAQQQFTGTNPTTLTLASAKWIDQFKNAAHKQSNKEMSELLDSAEANSLYIQDYSYFREAIGVAPDANMQSTEVDRFACAAVCLFHLGHDGKLHPLSIVIDYKKSVDDSVVIFNKRLQASDSKKAEATDWPWRFAKLCAQVSDWTRHEITIHLVNTHMVEEVVIVASHRTLPVDHPVFLVLEPHWLKTLSVNAAARSVLVPKVIVDLVGFTEQQSYKFINHAYENFNWTKLYIPTDLSARGFPIRELEAEKFHNYAYAKNMSLLWPVLHSFVSSMLANHYPDDQKVAHDKAITAWSEEMRSATGGNLKTFPVVKTFKDLVDAVTMCIHIASPQHTAINYLQKYYQSFVINKPPALCVPPPTNLKDLLAYKEVDLIQALPVNRQRQWLLASHLPHLLSFRVPEDQNLVNYAASLWNLYKKIHGENEEIVKASAAKLYKDLMELKEAFKKHSDDMDDNTIPYEVMDPKITAISILL